LDYRAAYLSRGGVELERQILATLESVRPDVVLYTQFPSTYSYVRPDFLASLRQRYRLVALGFDDEIYFDQAKFFYFRCHAVITTDIEAANALRQRGISAYVAHLQQPQSMGEPHSAEENLDVSFVGDMTKPGRVEFMRALERGGIRVADFGHGSRNGRLTDSEMIDVFRRSRINLNFTRTNPPAWVVRHNERRAHASQIKGRPFDLASLGKFCLCEWSACVEHWFKPGEEIGVFRGPDDLVAAARRYLDDSALRVNIASAALLRYRRHYAPEVQFQRLFSAILAQSKATSVAVPPAEPIFYESIGRSRAAAFLYAARAGRPIRALSEMIAGESAKLDYWRGFAGGLKYTMQRRLSLS
jgi:hypothetical protein